MLRIPAVLAGGTQQHVTCGVTDFAWVWLSPFPCLVHSRASLHFRRLPGTGRGAGCCREGISWGEMDDRQQHHRGEWGREGQRRIPGLGVRDGKWQEEGDWLVLRNRMIFPSPSWTLKLETPRESTVDLCFYRSLWSRLWNKSSCGALGGMLHTEFTNKVSPFSPPVLVRCWKCGYLHAQEYAGAKCQTQINTRVLILPVFTVFLI